MRLTFECSDCLSEVEFIGNNGIPTEIQCDKCKRVASFALFLGPVGSEWDFWPPQKDDITQIEIPVHGETSPKKLTTVRYPEIGFTATFTQEEDGRA